MDDQLDLNWPADICANRHRGNPESVAANEDNKWNRSKQRMRVATFIWERGKEGATVDECAIEFKTTPNAISGRFSELKKAGLIAKSGTRLTRSGSKAGVYIRTIL